MSTYWWRNNKYKIFYKIQAKSLQNDRIIGIRQKDPINFWFCITHLSTKAKLSLMFSILIPPTSPFYFEQRCSLKQILCSGNTITRRDCSLFLNYSPSLTQRKVRLGGSSRGIRICNCFSSIISSLQLLNHYGCHP